MILAQLLEGKVDLADALFFIAFIVFLVAAIIQWIETQRAGVVMVLMLIGLALVSFGWFAL